MKRTIAALVLVVAACSDSTPEATPPDVAFGRDTCRECGMIVSDPRFAASYWVDGEAWIFDDIGEMIQYGVRTKTLSVETIAWVHDYHSLEWIEADDAWYAKAPASVSPMGFGIAAFGEDTAAVTQAGFGGVVVRWENLFLLATEGRDPFVDHEH